MKKITTLGATALLALTLVGCGNNAKHKSVENKNNTTLSKAKVDVDSLFTNSKHNKLLDGTTMNSIKEVDNEVSKLKDSKTKDDLKKDTKKAKALYPEFKKELAHKNSISSSKAESSAKVAESKQSEKAKKSRVAESASKQKENTKSREEIQSIMGEMTKEQYLNIESKVLERMKFDDIKNPSDQGGFTRFHSSINNLMDLKDKASSTLKDEKQFLTNEDYNNLKIYTKSLQNYLSSLHDYAVIYQPDTPVINDSDTDEETRTASQKEVSESASDYTNAKNEWLEQYNTITQEYSN